MFEVDSKEDEMDRNLNAFQNTNQIEIRNTGTAVFAMLKVT